MTRWSAALAVAAATCATPRAASSAEITVFAPRAVATILTEVGSKFEAATGHHLNVLVDLTPTLVKRFRAGEAADIVIALPELIDQLVDDGKLLAETRSVLVRSGLGLEVRAGAPKPDISSVDQFKQAVLDAKSIGYLKTPAGEYLDQQFTRMGIADQIAPKATRPDKDIVSALVAKGEIEMGIVVTTQILTTPGVALVDRLPPDLQYYVTFTGAVATRSTHPSAAEDLLHFLSSPASKLVIEAQGMEPG